MADVCVHVYNKQLPLGIIQLENSTDSMKSTKVQTLGVVVLHTTTACTDDASIIGLSPLNWAIVSCLVLHVVYTHRVCPCPYVAFMNIMKTTYGHGYTCSYGHNKETV